MDEWKYLVKNGVLFAPFIYVVKIHLLITFMISYTFTGI
jgi:hypothetical protein